MEVGLSRHPDLDCYAAAMGFIPSCFKRRRRINSSISSRSSLPTWHKWDDSSHSDCSDSTVTCLGDDLHGRSAYLVDRWRGEQQAKT